MSDFWQSLAISAYESANAWRTQAIAAGLPVADLNPLRVYNNYQRAIADYREAESAYLNALIDNGGIGGGASSWNDLDDKPSTFTPSLHASTHFEGAADEITPANIGACELTGGLIPINRLPPLAITDRFSATSDAEMVALAAQMGDICFRSDQGRYYQKVNTEGLVTDWIAWLEPPVLSVNGLNGDVVLTPAIIGSPPNARNIATGTGLTGGGNLSADRNLSLANTAVTAGTYGSSTQSNSITVDAQGRVTEASQAAISAAYANITGYDSGRQNALAYGAGWESWGAFYEPAYRKNGNWVSLSGLVKRTATTGTVVLTLPLGYRSPIDTIFLTALRISTVTEPAFITINTSGVLTLVNPNPVSTLAYLSLDGISFHVN